MTADTARIDGVFFRNVCVLLALLALAGFALSYYMRAFAPAPPELTPLMHWHGLAFTLWMLLLVLQACLIHAGLVRWHRRLGYASVVLAFAMMALAAALAFERTLTWLEDPSFDSYEVLAFLAIPTTSILWFSCIYGAAIGLRHRPAVHKRLMLLACFDIFTPAVSRLPWMVEQSSWWHYAAIDLLLLAMLVHDWRAFKRLHAATLWGGAALLLSQAGREWLSRTDTWLDIALWLTA